MSTGTTASTSDSIAIDVDTVLEALAFRNEQLLHDSMGVDSGDITVIEQFWQENRDDLSSGSFDLAQGPYATYFATLMCCMDLQAVMEPTDDHTKINKTMSDLKISLNRASDVPAEEDTCLDALLRRGRQRLAERGLEDAFRNMSIDNSSEDKKDAVDTEVLGNTIAWWRSKYKCRMCGNRLLTGHALETFRLRKEELQQEFAQGRQSSAASTLRQPSRTETKAWLDRRCELQRSIHGLEHLMLLHDRKPDAERLSQNVRTGLTQLQTHYRTLPHDKSTTDQTSMTAGEVMEAFIRENAFALSVKNQPTPNIQLYIDCYAEEIASGRLGTDLKSGGEKKKDHEDTLKSIDDILSIYKEIYRGQELRGTASGQAASAALGSLTEFQKILNPALESLGLKLQPKRKRWPEQRPDTTRDGEISLKGMASKKLRKM